MRKSNPMYDLVDVGKLLHDIEIGPLELANFHKGRRAKRDHQIEEYKKNKQSYDTPVRAFSEVVQNVRLSHLLLFLLGKSRLYQRLVFIDSRYLSLKANWA